MQADIGLIGLAVMGQNLALNIERNGHRVVVYNRTADRTREFLAGPAAGKRIQAAYSVAELVAGLKQPRKVIVMVKAGAPVDAVIAELQPHLQPGDLLIDGGNSFYRDSERRSLDLERTGLNFLGVGISGGEEGALWGPSIMPGGHLQAYAMIQPVFAAIAAKVDGDPCVTYIGERGSGHFVKMVHNGIEYGDMQLIAEAYDLLRRGAGLGAHELGEVFARWNRGPLASFLIEITAQIFSVQDAATGAPLVELVRDEAQQKGTGKWASQEALDLGVPIPTLTAAVEARSLSAFRDERRQAAEAFPGETGRISGEVRAWIDAVEKALYAAKICAYAQGMRLLMAADQAYGYGLNYAEIARIWRGGCIIRARLLDEVRNAYLQDAGLANLCLAPFFRQALAENQTAWRMVVQQAAALGIPTPAMSASLAYFDSFRSPRLPANLIQAQRDLFGAHTYRRVDKEGDFHSDWSPG